MTPSSLPLADADPGTVTSADELGLAPGTATDGPDTYPTGHAGLARGWDGHAWASVPVPEAGAPALPGPRHSLRPSWRFWAAVGALVVGVGVAALASGLGDEMVRTALLGVAAVISSGGALLALTGAVWRRLRVVDAVQGQGWTRGRFVLLGVASGVLAVGLALVVELAAGHVFGQASVTVLFLAGPIEETAKLVLPVVLLLTVRRRLADPRTGFGLVWLSGLTFGLLEGVEYVAGLGPKTSHVPTDELATVVGAAAETAIRTLVELMHPMLTAGAAAALWLGAWRRGRLLGGAGVLAYLVAIVLHSVNDGVLGGWLHDVSAVLSLVSSPVMLLLIYAVLRLRSRELVPPSRVADLPPRWRPDVTVRSSEPRRRKP